MAVVQDSFDIPDEIMRKIRNGELQRSGGVVRCAKGSNKGRYFKIFDPIDVTATKAAQGIGTRILQYAKTHKKGLVIGGVVTIGGFLSVVYNVKNHEPAVMTEFRAALGIYIEEIKEGRLEVETIDNLTDALEALKAHKNHERFEIKLSPEDFDVLVSSIHESTIQLAEADKVELSDREMPQVNDSLLKFHSYLRAQKRILEDVA